MLVTFHAGLEPHSILPIAVPALMNTLSEVLPDTCRNCHGLATSIAFWIPWGRQVWWWLDLRPATRQMFDRLLKQGKTVCLTPGGVQECLYMQPGHEVAFLTKRMGFIKVAVQNGYGHRLAEFCAILLVL
jgi:diacylglycerol O-acyltransferase 2, plant